jgi:glyoxylase I family protein
MDDPTCDDLRRLEERLLRWSARNDADQLDALLADDFQEFGSSGRVFDKRGIIEALRGDEPVRRTMTDFGAVLLAPDVALVTYRVHRQAPDGSAAASLRSSVWQRHGGRWRMRFHQGTATPLPAAG